LVTGLIVRHLLTSLPTVFVDMPWVVGHGYCPVWYVFRSSTQTLSSLTHDGLILSAATAVGTDMLHDSAGLG
jgi:hypothetical protein